MGKTAKKWTSNARHMRVSLTMRICPGETCCYILPTGSAAALTAPRWDQLPSLTAAKSAFLTEYGSWYGYNGWIDAHWQEEVGVRLPDDQHYLDHTGACIECSSIMHCCCNSVVA